MGKIKPLHLEGNSYINNFNDFTNIRNMFANEHGEIPYTIRMEKCVFSKDLIEFLENEGFNHESHNSRIDKNNNEHLSATLMVNESKTIFIPIFSSFTSDSQSKGNKVSITESFYIFYKNDDVTKLIIDKIKVFHKNAKEFKEVQEKQIHVVIPDESGALTTAAYDIKFPIIDIDVNYNDTFSEINDIIIDGLNNKNGLVLLHGEPGCGKTNYIKYLTNEVTKKLIFLPPNMSDQLSNPQLLELLLRNKDSVLIIEDAENAIKSRKGNNTGQSISNILNMSDGLLSDILNISIIATFNCDVSDIDEALLRKGRLLANYEFDKLDKKKAQMLSDKLGFKTIITEDSTLSEIYNQEDKSFKEEKKTIGFNFN